MGCSMTEQEVIDLLISSAKDNGEISPRVVVMTRVQPKRSLTRVVRFALVVTSDNITLVDAMVKAVLPYDELDFVGSELNLQGDMDIAYLYFEASIIANIK